jgi:glycosyltransferase involved in cell wall biosynthesis
MSEPLVSVIMNVYNREKYLGKAIESVLNQTYKNFEFIIVNDGSVDNSKNIALSYDDPRIKFIDNPINSGIGKSRNIGLKHTRGKYIWAVDSDDIADPVLLEKLVKVMESDNNCVFSISFARGINDNGEIVMHRKYNYFPQSKEAFRYQIALSTFFAHSGSLMLKDAIIKVSGYSETLKVSVDYDLFSRLIDLGDFLVLPEYLMYYRVDEKCTTVKVDENTRYSCVKPIIKENFEKKFEIIIDDETSENIAKLGWNYKIQGKKIFRLLKLLQDSRKAFLDRNNLSYEAKKAVDIIYLKKYIQFCGGASEMLNIKLFFLLLIKAYPAAVNGLGNMWINYMIRLCMGKNTVDLLKKISRPFADKFFRIFCRFQ